MYHDRELIFIGNIPERLGNELLRELLGVFGEVKEFKRVRDLQGLTSNWVFVEYYGHDSVELLYGVLPGVTLGSSKLAIRPSREETACGRDDIVRKINRINMKYGQELEAKNVLTKFVSSYVLADGDGGEAFSSALKKWLQEESEIRRRCIEMETDIGERLERRKQAEFQYLSSYDDDNPNGTSHPDRTGWMTRGDRK